LQWREKHRLKLIIFAEPNRPENTSSFKQSFAFLYVLVRGLLCLRYVHVFRRSRSVFVNYYWTRGWHNTPGDILASTAVLCICTQNGEWFFFKRKMLYSLGKNCYFTFELFLCKHWNVERIKALRFRENEPVFNYFSTDCEYLSDFIRL